MTNQHFEIQSQGHQRSSRRTWTDEEKRKILDDAVATSISAASRKHGIRTNLLFQWRRQQIAVASSEVSERSMHNSILIEIEKFKSVETALVQKLMADLLQDRIAPFQASCTLSNLTNSFVKATALKLEILDRLKSLPNEEPDDEHDKEVRRGLAKIAEKWLHQKLSRNGKPKTEGDFG